VLRWMHRWLTEITRLALMLGFAALLILQVMTLAIKQGMGAGLLLSAGGVLIFLALLAFHELGHVLASRIMGLPFTGLTVGLLRVVREGDRIRVRLNTAWFQPAAFVAQKFPDGSVWPLGWVFTVLGGPLANLLLGVMCLVVASWINPSPPMQKLNSAGQNRRSVALFSPGDLPTAYLNVTAILSLGLGLGTLVPGRSAGLRTDGGQLLDFWRLLRSSQKLGYPLGASLMVFATLIEVSRQRGQTQKGKTVHLSARELCDYLVKCRGAESATILWGYKLRRSEDVSRIIFGLVNAGLVIRGDSDSEADFQGLYELKEPDLMVGEASP